MRVINNSTGRGEIKHYTLTEENAEILSLALKKKLTAENLEELQKILSDYFEWEIYDFQQSAEPIFEFYEELDSRLSAVAEILNRGPASGGADVKHLATYIYNSSRRLDDDPEYVRLQMIAHFGAQNAKAALKNLELHHTHKLKEGRPTNDEIDRLVFRLMLFAKAMGVSPFATYSPAKGNRRTRFVEFVDKLFALLNDYLPQDLAEPESLIRRLEKRFRAMNKKQPESKGGT